MGTSPTWSPASPRRRATGQLRAVATGLCRQDEEIAEHLRATRSPRCHTAAGAALVWTECGREVDPEQVDCETATCRRCGEIDRQLRHDTHADVGAVSRDGGAPGRPGGGTAATT